MEVLTIWIYNHRMGLFGLGDNNNIWFNLLTHVICQQITNISVCCLCMDLGYMADLLDLGTLFL